MREEANFACLPLRNGGKRRRSAAANAGNAASARRKWRCTTDQVRPCRRVGVGTLSPAAGCNPGSAPHAPAVDPKPFGRRVRRAALASTEADMARAPKVTWERLDDAIDAGHGTGHGETYKPMLEIKRWNPSPVSVQVRKALPPFERVCNFFSRSEWLLGLLFAWLGALIREQFPLWPWSHPHPAYGLNDDCDKDLLWSIGMECRR